jgi:hypothetical protein
MTFDDFLDLSPLNPPGQDKADCLLPALVDLTAHHCAHCPDYARVVAATASAYGNAERLVDLPFLPVSLFKTHRLQSVDSSTITTMLHSSGTTGIEVSHIAVDAITAERQALALASIIAPVLGAQRLPMIVLDCKSVIKTASQLSARGAGVLGMMRFGRHHHFAFDEDMRLDVSGLAAFLERFGDKPFFLFGFTFVVWHYFYQALQGRTDLSNGILLHSGGWKRLQNLAVDNAVFKRSFLDKCGLARIRNFYGMAEQLGSICLEGEDGFLHPPVFGDVLIRDVETWDEAAPGKPGLIQVLSLVPRSYAGHSLITEDIGVVQPGDEGPGGWRGKALTVLGRAQKMPLRGCSDAVEFGGH